ncbi:unnamed protein product [Orchesella dallaii]|uniref:Uncharacterized protein n=1 Tax=Orchesella dallaii TaxID=48710 RepID=A0ABP1QJA8_9HEXA
MKPETAAANVHEIDLDVVQESHNATGYWRGIGRGKKPPPQTNPHSLAPCNESASPKPGSSWFPTSGPSISSSGSQCGHSMTETFGCGPYSTRKVKRTEATTTLTAGQRKIRRAEVDTEQEKVNRDAVNAEGDE